MYNISIIRANLFDQTVNDTLTYLMTDNVCDHNDDP